MHDIPTTEHRQGTAGFTLIELIAVLIVLGILVTVAVSKYMDLLDTSRQRAVAGALAEMNARTTQAYATGLMNKATAANFYDDLDFTRMGDFVVTTPAAASDYADGALPTVTLTFDGSTFTCTATDIADGQPGHYQMDGVSQN